MLQPDIRPIIRLTKIPDIRQNVTVRLFKTEAKHFLLLESTYVYCILIQFGEQNMKIVKDFFLSKNIFREIRAIALSSGYTFLYTALEGQDTICCMSKLTGYNGLSFIR